MRYVTVVTEERRGKNEERYITFTLVSKRVVREGSNSMIGEEGHKDSE